jgi:hypothetical protein
LQLSLGRVLAKRAHHRSELLDGDRSISVLVKEREGLLELCKDVIRIKRRRVEWSGSVIVLGTASLLAKGKEY